jgi:rhodanese-related sulfurtransferase
MNHHPAFLNLVDQSRKQVKESDLEDLVERFENSEPFTLIDVREESEYANGYIPGAIWMGKGIIERDIEARFPDKEIELWLYCGGGYRSVLAADNLQKMGYTKVISVDGGFKAWFNSGRQIDQPGKND